MKSTQKVVSEYLERKAEEAGQLIMASPGWANTGTWRIVNDEGVTSELSYNFQQDYVTFGGFAGDMFLYQGQYHLILQHLRNFVNNAK